MTTLPLGPIAERAQADPEGIALVDSRRVWTWSQIAEVLESVAGGLVAVAPASDQKWGVFGDNAGQTMLTHAAGHLVGVGTVALSRQLTAREIADQVSDAGIVGIVTGRSSLPAVLEAAKTVKIHTIVVHGDPTDEAPDSPASVTWDEWIAHAPAAPRDIAAHRSPAPLMVYTSGTTGRARGTEVRWIVKPTNTALEYLEAVRSASSLPSGPHLVVGPLQHNGPLTALRHFLAGGTVVLMPRFDGASVLTTIAKYGVESSVMVPTHFQRLLAVPDYRSYDISSLKLVAHTGSACPPNVKREMIDWFGPILIESYGGSETGTLCRITSEEWLKHPGSVGRAVAPFEVLVLDEDHRAVPLGVQGLLCFKAPEERAIRYHQDPEKTASAQVLPGVLTLGDMGHVDAQGFVFVTDRASDMVVSGGVNLYPSESERVLESHPGVAEVAVIGVPHEDLGEQLLAIVVPTDPANLPDPKDLERHCRASLAAYKVPRKFKFVDRLPRNEMQKVDKKLLRRPFWGNGRNIAG